MPSAIIRCPAAHANPDAVQPPQCLRRYKTIIINNSRLAALRGILEQLLCHRDYDRPYDKDLDAEDLARSWFNNKEAQTRAAELLGQFQMDEGALEAEAFRSCSEDVERLDRMLTALEFRRDKALRSVTDYQQSLSKQLQQAASNPRKRRGAASRLAIRLTMASERQIEANRRNARHSSGPRSKSGKKSGRARTGSVTG